MPRKPLSDQEINTAKIRDQNKKTDRENVYNSCRLTRDFFFFQIGNCVLVRNYRRRFKFDSYFLPENCYVIDILANENTLLMKNAVSGCLMAHITLLTSAGLPK